MRSRLAFVMALLLALPALLMVPGTVSANSLSGMDLSIPGLEMRTDADGAIVVVAMIYHDLNLTFADPVTDAITVDMHRADLTDEDPTDSGWYRWTWDANSTEWLLDGFDANHTSFLDSGYVDQGGRHAWVRLGIDSGAGLGDWVMAVSADGVDLQSWNLSLVEPRTGIAHSSPSYLFRQEPGSGNVTQIAGDQTFSVQNTGNVRVKPIWEVVTSLVVLQDRLNLTELPTTMLPQESVRVGVSYETGLLRPGFYPWSIRLTFQPLHVIASGTVSLRSQVAVDVAGTIIAARPGLQIDDAGGGALVMQYPGSFSTPYEDSINLVVYLTGRVEAAFDVTAPDFDIVAVEFDGVRQSTPHTLLLDEATENRVLILLRPNVDNKVTSIDLSLRSTDDSLESVASITVSIDRRIPVIRGEDSGTDPLMVLGIIGGVLLVIGALLGTVFWLDRRRNKQ